MGYKRSKGEYLKEHTEEGKKQQVKTNKKLEGKNQNQEIASVMEGKWEVNNIKCSGRRTKMTCQEIKIIQSTYA